ncbi:hypothetical protein PVAND_009890 [Polypedilum vanderplanki]|uniref:Conserved oligomeric Golgi complex subunit 8 n=1 Tax=Polypedilum vanderplanki TaxID=319348 RepID=A0A9J6CEN0_POLVA|nr:hypothetical protein PVAND_009890 [Polypedilum vanderplanki]
MESEDKILKLINFDANASDKNEAINYLQKLRGYKVENLKKDTITLNDDLSNQDLKMQEISFQNYQSFIQTAESSRTVLKKWNETTKHVENLIDKVPAFNENCDDFVKTSFELNTMSRLNNLTMKKHVELLEILDLPTLMQTSIRDQKYADALELATYVEKLSSKFDNVPIINDIVKTIESSWNVMLTQLLSELKCDLTLPKCLQIVGYLRRMQAFSTSELKLKFLQTRDSWFKEILASIPKTDPFQHLIKTIEVTRVNLFNIITQYKALFDDDFTKDTNTKINLMFCSWLHEKIDDFLKTLDTDLSNSCNGSITLMDIGSVLGQCMYFGVSFSRIGVDFRAQTVPIFTKTIIKYLSTAVKKATRQFESDMEKFTLINKDIVPFKRHLKNEEESEKTEKEDANAPSDNLLDFEPLAIYCNAIINIFNELRVCAPLAVLQPFVQSLESSLETVSKAILTFYRSEQQAFGIKEKENFLKMCSSFSFELVPYIQKCINVIFPANHKVLMNLESISTLKTEKILDPIEHLLPDQFKTTKI